MHEPFSAPFTACLAAGAALWWLAGGFLLLLTPLPAHTDQLGWSPLYWLALAPLCVVAGLRLRRAGTRPAG
ncbi:hypothetical protein [Fulvimonas yonginensis]|uniref:Uncharacterized protein n=1 Tax=Fulvimonas yonginensis TaxID=1495200 RepID=A0ABU8J7N7_9GAMM